MSRLTPSVRSSNNANTSGAHSVSVSIPAGSTWAIIGIGFYSGTNANPPTSVSLDGQTATLIDSATDNTADQCAIYKVASFSTGASKTLAWTNGAGYGGGVEIAVEFRDGTPTYGAHGSGFTASSPGTASTSSLANSSGDEIISFYSANPPGTAVTLGTGQSKLDETTDATGNFIYGFSTETATGSGDVQSATGDIIAIASTVVTVASAAVRQTLMLTGVGF